MSNVAKKIYALLPPTVWILIGIMIIGIALRTYQYHNWLRFNNDQARDAAVTSDMIVGKSFPLLGPKAGGTEFKLGPAFYYIQAASGAVFGNYPDKQAYPELFFSILTIPLLYFFVRRVFSEKTSLTLAFLGAISYFAVRYGRFSWNPNAEPFWVILFLLSLLMIFNATTKRKWVWTIAAGAALGVAVQLHTLLLVVLPVYALLILGYAWYTKLPIKKYFAVIAVVAIALNATQFMDLSRNGGKNIQAFFSGNKAKQSRNGSVIDSARLVADCSLQADIHIVSGLGDNDTCSFFKMNQKRLTDRAWAMLTMVLGLFLAVGGAVLFVRKFRSALDPGRRHFLLFVGLYTVLSLLVLVPVAHDVSMRFYLGMYFVPFVLLGLCFEWMSQLKWKWSTVAVVLLVGFLFVTNVRAIVDDFYSFSTEARGFTSIITLGDLERITTVIDSQVGSSRKAVIEGKGTVLFHLYRPLVYVASLHNLELSRSAKNPSQSSDVKTFVVGLTNDENVLPDGAVLIRDIGRYSVIELK